MLFKTTLIALLASASALRPESGIPADSKAGMSLMSQARMLDQNQQQDDGDDDMTWMVGYSIKYLGCSALLQVREDAGEDDSNLFTMNMVKFGLCSNDSSCSSCGNGKAQYVVNMEAFVNAYTEMQMNAQEQACEYVRENCYCDDDGNDDEACENTCYTNMGMEECIEYEGDEEFNAQEYLECNELEAAQQNNGNNYNGNNNDDVNMYQQYYVGPTCSNGFDINLATFYDNGCSKKTKSGVYAALNYGASLPFEKSSMVSDACVSCLQVDENGDDGNNNGNQDYEVTELCQESYEEAAKCESGLSGVKYYADESGCDYINNVLPKLVKATNSITKSQGSRSATSGSSAATGWAIFFFLTAAVFSAYAFFLYRKIHRAKVNLAAGEGELA